MKPLRRQRVGVELARREHHLAQLAVDVIPVVVDRDEVVVRADRLDLPERLEQRLAIPESHVVDRRAVGRDRLRCELGASTPSSCSSTPSIPHALSRRLDVMRDLRRLARSSFGCTTSR